MKREDITNKWLGDIGGWQVLKQAKVIHKNRGVLKSSCYGESPLVIKGVVATGKRELAAGLRVRSKTDVENLCSCFMARRDGTICEHSIAVALHLILRGQETESSGAAESESKAPKAVEAQESYRGFRARFEMREDLETPWNKGKIQLLAKIEREPDCENDPGVQWLAKRGITPSGSGGSMPIVLKKEELSDLWTSLRGTDESIEVGEVGVAVGEIEARLRVVVSENGDGKLTLERRPLPDRCQLLTSDNMESAWLWSVESMRLLPVALPGVSRTRKELWPLIAEGEEIEMPVEWFLGASAVVEEAFLLESEDDFLRRFSVRPAKLQCRLGIEGSLNAVSARLEFRYFSAPGEALCDFVPAGGKGEIPLMRDPADPLKFLSRDSEAESRAIARLVASQFSEPDEKGWLQLRGEDGILDFFAGALPRLQADEDWEIEVGERFRHVTRNVEVVRPVLSGRSGGEDWLEVSMKYETASGADVSPGEIQRLLQMGKPGLKKPDGKRLAFDLDAIRDLQEVVRDADPEQRDGHLRLSPNQAAYLAESASHWRGVIEDLFADQKGEAADFGSLAEVLRDYQQAGAEFLFERALKSSGALLADEMGLGKTLQTLAAIQAMKGAGERGAALIVCPTSLLRNWEAEAQKWTPDLRSLVLHGAKREPLFKQIEDHDLVFTSYGLLVRDVERHEARNYLAVVLDEASLIRNPDTQMAKAARRLQSRGRIALTGTPIENSVRDVWSLFQFTSPGYLGSREDFKERYELPIARDPGGTSAEQERLRRRLKPFLLRRTKREVAPELPEKIEQVRLCELTPAQAAVYQELLKKGQTKVDELLKKQGFAAARMSILSILLRLRQACCDLRILDGFEKKKDDDSAKLGLLSELMDEAEAGDHRVLVFSQFVSVLSLLKDWLAGDEREYAYIDGSVSADKRAEEVRRFQSPDGPGVFLISLKAGGYGLNLTAADTVVHFDPWWNPAVEQQATDRAHRIGQEKSVNVYKLICAGTVEEKILRLQAKKRQVIDAAINDEAPMMGGLNEEDLREILG
ncbi:MAG: SNF2-related protein [Verrucomicrobiota bacterium]